MKTYSLLQERLDQTIRLEELAEAVQVAPPVARADCPQLHRDLFGMVVSQLPPREAVMLQDKLRHFAFPTRVVPDHELPRLPEEYQVQRLEREGDRLRFTDAMGRVQDRLHTDLVFLAGGFLMHFRLEEEAVRQWEVRHTSAGALKTVETVYERRRKEVPQFRLDFFFWTEKRRLHMSLSEETVLFDQGRKMRLRHPGGLLAWMAELRELLPAERVGSGLQRAHAEPFSPSLQAYNEEIRWHFHRLASAAGGQRRFRQVIFARGRAKSQTRKSPAPLLRFMALPVRADTPPAAGKRLRR